MSCSNITQGISKGCNNNLGGIRNILISEQPITGYVVSGGIVTSFSPSPTWIEIEADQGTGNFLETYEINQMGGIIAFKQSVTFQINDLKAYNQQRIAELAESTNLGCVVEMNNGKFFTCGLEHGAYLETGSTGSGTAYGDLSGSTITITGMEQISSLEVSPVAVDQVNSMTIWYEWEELDACQNGSVAVDHDFRFGTYQQAKCEFDACNEYLALDPLGCYPGYNVTIRGRGLYYAKGETLGVGTTLYQNSGLIYDQDVVFWYQQFPIIPFTGNAPNQLRTDMVIGEVYDGVITKWQINQNVTC